MSELKERIQSVVKEAMKARASDRLITLRMVTAAIRQREIDERIELDDAQVLAVLGKMVKQRREAEEQFRRADRADLADKERAEIGILQEFLPAQLTDVEIDARVVAAIAESGATSPRDMGQVMRILKRQLEGRADMGPVSGKVKDALSQPHP